MKRTVPIIKNYEFKRVYNKGNTSPGNLIVVYSLTNKKGAIRLGLTVSKKIGNAVSRNRARRLMREAYRLLEPQLKGGLDFVIVARSKCVTSTCPAVMQDMLQQFKKLGVINEEAVN